jgi:hypothetical protein
MGRQRERERGTCRERDAVGSASATAARVVSAMWPGCPPNAASENG